MSLTMCIGSRKVIAGEELYVSVSIKNKKDGIKLKTIKNYEKSTTK